MNVARLYREASPPCYISERTSWRLPHGGLLGKGLFAQMLENPFTSPRSDRTNGTWYRLSWYRLSHFFFIHKLF